MERADPSLVIHRPTTAFDRFFDSLRRARRRLLLLDYDGTLAPFHVNPAWATPYDGVREALDEIMRDRRSTVAIVSGRPARDLHPLLRLRRPPVIWGSHGWERLDTDGDYRCGPLNTTGIRRLMQEDHWMATIKEAGARIERKPASVAIHWRGLNAHAIKLVRQTVEREWNGRRLDTLLRWIDFDGGIELSVPGRNKGFVVDCLLKENSGVVAAYLGDDLADEDAFKAIKTRGIGVLVRSQYRPTFAQAWLRPPGDLLDFLDRWRSVRGR